MIVILVETRTGWFAVPKRNAALLPDWMVRWSGDHWVCHGLEEGLRAAGGARVWPHENTVILPASRSRFDSLRWRSVRYV